MTRPVRALLTLLALALLPWSAQAEARLATGAAASASATVKLRLVIPPVVRVLDNRHPAVLSLADTLAHQELEVLTTLRQGFCAVLRLNATGVRDWTVRSSNAGVQILRTADGYRICAPRNGRHRVALEHRFSIDGAPDPTSAAALPWPVQTELSAL